VTEKLASVVVLDEQDDHLIDIHRWADLARCSLASRNVRVGEVNLIFVEETQIHELNRLHMGKDRPTDVLSFPLDGPDAFSEDSLIGDIVVCPAVAAKNAAEHVGQDHHRGTIEDELALLVVHGVLHILGFDHMNDSDAEIMESIEQELLGAHYR